MRVAAEEQRPVDTCLMAVAAGRFDNGQDVVFVEGSMKRRAAVSRRPKRHSLAGDRRIRVYVVVGGDQSIDVDQVRRISRLSGGGGARHVGLFALPTGKYRARGDQSAAPPAR